MNKTIIADSGVITAFLDKREQHHQFARENWQNLPAPFITCEAVICESCFLLRNEFDGQTKILTLIESGVLQIDFSLNAEISAVKDLMKRYENVPMSLADACLVRMSEQIENSVVFTLDGDFWIYRKNGNAPIDLIIP